MSNETYLPVVGNLTADPQLRFTPNGAAVANFTIASTAQKFNRNTNEWEDETTRFWDCNAWNSGKLTLAENVVETLKKGDKVIAYGELKPRNFETKEGEKRSVIELRVMSIGKNLMFHKAGAQAGASDQPPAHQSGGYGVPQSSQQPTQQGGWGNQPQQQQQQQQPQQGGGWNQPQQQQQPPAQNAPQQGGGWNAPASDPWTASGNPGEGWGNQQ